MVALPEDADPSEEPRALRVLLTRAAGARNFANLKARLARTRREAHGAFLALVGG